MDEHKVIEVDAVSKKFSKSLKQSMIYGFFDIMRATVGIKGRGDVLRKGEFWAVDGVSFDIRRGEVMGIIGSNGSGKTTLLKMLCGILTPDAGSVAVRGKVGALIAVGAGFHPALSGRENIYLNGAILGMDKRLVDEKFDEIVAFSDIGDFIDTPVKFYSSGMFVKLGFSVAVHADPDILIIDEILAVGDFNFQNKCLRAIRGLRDRSKTIILVSHNLEVIHNFCDRTIVLDAGRQCYQGGAHEAVVFYQGLMAHKAAGERPDSYGAGVGAAVIGPGEIKVDEAGILAADGNVSGEVPFGSDIRVYFDLTMPQAVEDLHVSVGVFNERNEICVWVMNERIEDGRFRDLSAGRYRLDVVLEKPNLSCGSYSLSLAIRNARTLEVYSKMRGFCKFVVTGDRVGRGVVEPRVLWQISRK